jgi:hypothetical protein
VELHAAGILAALAAAVFAAQCTRGRAAFVLLGVFVGAAFAFARFGSPDVPTFGFCLVAAAVTMLARPQWTLLPGLAAGIAAAGWISILEAQGLPWLPGALAAAGLLAVGAGLAARRRGFMSAEVRDEALVLVASFALLLAVGPDVVDGWRSSVALKAGPLAAAGPQVGPWLGALVVGVVLLGAAYTAWKRR